MQIASTRPIVIEWLGPFHCVGDLIHQRIYLNANVCPYSQSEPVVSYYEKEGGR